MLAETKNLIYQVEIVELLDFGAMGRSLEQNQQDLIAMFDWQVACELRRYNMKMKHYFRVEICLKSTQD